MNTSFFLKDDTQVSLLSLLETLGTWLVAQTISTEGNKVPTECGSEE